MVLGKLPVPGRPTIWMIVGQGPTVLAVGAATITSSVTINNASANSTSKTIAATTTPHHSIIINIDNLDSLFTGNGPGEES